MDRSKYKVDRTVRRIAVLGLALLVVIVAPWASRVGAGEFSSALFGQVASAAAVFPAATQAGDEDAPKVTPDEEFAKRAREYQKERNTWNKTYRDTEPQERRKLMAEYQEIIGKYVEVFEEFAQEHRKTPAAARALNWIVQNGRSSPGHAQTVKEAIDQLIADHQNDAEFAQTLALLQYVQGIDAEAIYRQTLEESDSDDAKGMACYYLAKQVIGRALRTGNLSEEKEQQAVAMFQRAKEEFGDVKLRGRTLAEIVEPDLFELLHLRVGKTAPEIEGEDIDGEQLKLTDYRGKVVVLDFWGHW